MKIAKYLYPWMGGSFTYELVDYEFNGSDLTRRGNSSVNFTGLDIELELSTYWNLLTPGTYHDMFFSGWRVLPQRTDIPQIIGSVGEIVAVLAMRQRYSAVNIHPLHPTPQHKSADFEMELPKKGELETAVMEVKATNQQLNQPDLARVREGSIQVTVTQKLSPGQYDRAFVSLVLHRSGRIFLVEVV